MPGSIWPFVAALPAGEKWTFELKVDGYRSVAVKRGREVAVNALVSLDGDFVLDGELVALDPQGKPFFQLLQGNISQSLPIYFYVFDLLKRNGELRVNLPLSRRRELLRDLLAAPKDPLLLSPLLQAPSGEVLEAVRKLGLEGIVGKRIDSVYEPGERSGAWIKIRVNLEQEFVIGGYIPGARGFDALLVGVYEKKELIFVAKVKNGFVPRIRDEIFPVLKALQIAQCPFKNLPEKRASRWGDRLPQRKWTNADGSNQIWSARSHSSNGRTRGT
jgi:ATP-dependent DNA ligase